MLVNEENIISIIPQRAPFVMISELVGIDDNVTYTKLSIRSDNVLVENGYLSEAGLTENMAQTAAAGAGYRAKQSGSEVADGYIGAIRNLNIFSLPAVGTIIETNVRVQDQVFDITGIHCEVRQSDHVLATCDMKIFTKPLVSLNKPDQV